MYRYDYYTHNHSFDEQEFLIQELYYPERESRHYDQEDDYYDSGWDDDWLYDGDDELYGEDGMEENDELYGEDGMEESGGLCGEDGINEGDGPTARIT